MRKQILFMFLLIFGTGTVHAQSLFPDSVQLQSVEINAKLKDESSPATHQKVLDSAILSNRSSGNLGKAIAENTGIFVKTYGQGALATVSFRGSGASHTGVYWNGFSLNSAMNGMVDLSLLPIAFYDKVEIDYGNSSIQKGAGGLGGSINLRNIPDFTNKLSIDFQQSIGSYGHIGSFGSFGIGSSKLQAKTRIYRQSAVNDFDYRNLGKEGFPIEKQENAGFLQEGIMQSLYFRPDRNHLVKIEAWYVNSERELPSIMTVNNKDEQQKDESFRILASVKKYLGKGSVELASNYQYEFLDYSNKILEQSSVTNTNSWKNLLSAEHRLSQNLQIHAKLHFDFQEIKNDIYSKGQRQLRQATYLAGHYKIQDLDFEVFARQEWISDQDISLLPGAAMRYYFGAHDHWSLSSSIAKNMKYPTLNDLYWIPAGNPDLEVEQSTNMEVQLSTASASFSRKLSSAFSVSFFSYNIDNYIQWQPTAFGYWRAENLKQIKSRGLELEGQMSWLSAIGTFILDGSYSYTRSENIKALQEDDQSVGKQLFYVPVHLWNVHLEMRRNDYWLKISQHYTGLRYTTSDNSDFLPPFSLLAVKFGKSWKFNEHTWSLELAVDNLLDKDYQAIQWRPMPGRNFLASIKYHFSK